MGAPAEAQPTPHEWPTQRKSSPSSHRRGRAVNVQYPWDFPSYLLELERLIEPGGHFSYFDRTSIYSITYGVLEDWSLWLGISSTDSAT